ncbi:MAG TPA: D-serine/D-alanine/glycine transporter, partial [Xanthomonadaceae bacterium]|nr:D-serine/D-alanine/glycine transporter [Xanthomonadaceae bacterium]
HAASAFRMPGGVFMCYACLAFFGFVLVLLTLQPDTLQALLASPVWFLILGAGYLWKGRRAGIG